MLEEEVRVGGALGPLGVMPGGRSLLHAYLDDLEVPSITKTSRTISRTTREWWRRRYPPTSRSNWREYARQGGGIPEMPEMVPPEPRRHRSSADGERSKDEAYSVKSTLTPVWVGNIPLTEPVMGDDTVDVSRSIRYQIGSVEQFHECYHTWNYPIESVLPFCGLVRKDDHVEWTGYVAETHPEDLRYSKGHFTGREVTLGTPRLVPTRDYPVELVRPTTREVDDARYNALLSMYGGTPPTMPNMMRALFELKDTKKTINGLVHFYKWARTMASGAHFWRKTLNGWRKLRGGEIARLSTQEMASAYLNGVFGIAPTLQDAETFLHRILTGLNVFSVPQGTPAIPGSVITSRYRVRPRSVEPRSFSTVVSQRVRVNTHVRQNKMFCDGNFAPRPLGQTLRAVAPDLVVEEIRGCVFARLKEDLSDYFLANFGKVGLTWSYPPILTAWELLPWTWMIDWFARTRQSIRLAERAARTYWMRVGFNDPWLAERRILRRYCHRLLEDREISSDNRVFWPSYNQRVLDATVTSTYSITPGASYEVSGSFWRGLYADAPRLSSQATGITVRTFQISIGMALVLQTR